MVRYFYKIIVILIIVNFKKDEVNKFGKMGQFMKDIGNTTVHLAEAD